MKKWLALWVTDVRTNIAAGRSEIIERRYIPLAVLVGAALGVFISFVVPFLAAVAVLAVGFLLGYAARSYVSHRRRLAYYQTKMDGL